MAAIPHVAHQTHDSREGQKVDKDGKELHGIQLNGFDHYGEHWKDEGGHIGYFHYCHQNGHAHVSLQGLSELEVLEILLLILHVVDRQFVKSPLAKQLVPVENKQSLKNYQQDFDHVHHAESEQVVLPVVVDVRDCLADQFPDSQQNTDNHYGVAS